MHSIALLAHRFGRLAGLGAVGLLAAAGAINSAVAESPTGPSPYAAPAPAIQTLEAPVPVVAPQFVFSSPMPGFNVNSRFGFRKLPGAPGRMHEGVDFAAPAGAPIRSAGDGKILQVGSSATYGNFVEVDHGDGVTTFYAHMSRRAATSLAGREVRAGDTLGFVGSTGRSTGPHLHFEVRKNERQFDPMQVIGRTFASLDEIPVGGMARATRASAANRAPVPYTVLNGRVRSTLG